MTPGYVHRRARNDERAAAEKAFVDSLRVERFPCPRCGTRSDVGCRHLGTVGARA